MAPYEGDLESYRAMLLSRDKPASKAKPEAKKLKRPSRDAILGLKSDVRKCEQRVDKLNEMSDRLATKLANPALYENADEAAVWQKKYAEVREALERAEALWMAALEKLEKAET